MSHIYTKPENGKQKKYIKIISYLFYTFIVKFIHFDVSVKCIQKKQNMNKLLNKNTNIYNFIQQRCCFYLANNSNYIQCVWDNWKNLYFIKFLTNCNLFMLEINLHIHLIQQNFVFFSEQSKEYIGSKMIFFVFVYIFFFGFRGLSLK